MAYQLTIKHGGGYPEVYPSRYSDPKDCWQDVLQDFPTITEFYKGYITALREIGYIGSAIIDWNYGREWASVMVEER